MKFKIDDLTPAQLDILAAIHIGAKFEDGVWHWPNGTYSMLAQQFTQDWNLGALIMDAHKMTTKPAINDGYIASTGYFNLCIQCSGPTRLIAVIRCAVTSAFGPEIELPADFFERPVAQRISLPLAADVLLRVQAIASKMTAEASCNF